MTISGLATPITLHSRPEPVPPAIISRDGERELSAELGRLRRRLQVEFPERLREARDFGEIGQNDDYLQIKEEEAVLVSRIQHLDSLLSSAIVVDPTGTTGGVTIGMVVEAEDVASGDIRSHRLTGSFEDHGPDDVSASSPIGQALLGRGRGDQVTAVLPGKRSIVLKTLAVRSPAA